MFQTIRNHWKKSLFALCAVSYGSKWMYDRYESNKIRRFYCEQAAQLGSQTYPSMSRLNRIAVLVNGKANNNKAKAIYDKTIYPLLHLTGLDVRVYRLDALKDADDWKDLLTNRIEPNELKALVIVGGDGTLSQLSPYLYENSTLENLPICLIPIGEKTTFARQLFPLTNKQKLHDDLHLLCESVFALFNGTIVRKPLLKISLSNEEPIYASTFDIGHYSRLEQIQKRLWYFSYLKYPISSIYYFLINSKNPIVSSNHDAIVYSNPCSGCTKCQPNVYEQTLSNTNESKSTFFSKFYQSNRSNMKSSTTTSAPIPFEENPECGLEQCLNTQNKPIQLSARVTMDDHSFQLDISDDFRYFTFDHTVYPKQTLNVGHIRFHPNRYLLRKHFLINNEKFEFKTPQKNDDSPIECRIELTKKKLKFLQINPDLLVTKTARTEPDDEDLLEKKGIFLFSRRSQRVQ